MPRLEHKNVNDLKTQLSHPTEKKKSVFNNAVGKGVVTMANLMLFQQSLLKTCMGAFFLFVLNILCPAGL